MLFKNILIFCAVFAIVKCDDRVRFRFFRKGVAVKNYSVTSLHQILQHNDFVRNRQTVMFHHSDDQTMNTPPVNDVMTSYANHPDLNFIMIHYENPSTVSSRSANDLAAGIASALLDVFNSGYNSGLMSLIGFGLGAQILARSSRTVQNQSNKRHMIGRLTGIDPIDLRIFTGISIGRFSSADAQWVESIHTEGSSFGDLNSRGHIAFFVNGGVTQPMCGQGSARVRARCSHEFGLTYWAESVRSKVPIFPSLQCDTWQRYMVGACNGNFESFMGRANWQANLRGTYFLQTNIIPPFSRNKAGPF